MEMICFHDQQLEQEAAASNKCCSDHLSCVCQVLFPCSLWTTREEEEKNSTALDHHSSLRSERSSDNRRGGDDTASGETRSKDGCESRISFLVCVCVCLCLGTVQLLLYE